MPSGAVVVFTRDLRVDRPPRARAARCARHERRRPAVRVRRRHPRRRVQPTEPHRASCSSRSPISTRALRSLGGRLVVRRGDWVDEVAARRAHDVGAAAVHVSDDVSAYARARLARLEPRPVRRRRRRTAPPAITIVAPGAVTPGDAGDHYKVFTPYYRRWSDVRRRRVDGRTRRASTLPARRRRRARCPALADLVDGRRARPTSCPGGAAGRPRAARRLGRARPRAATPTATTTSPATRPRGSRRTCTSGASRRSRCARARRRAARAPTRSSGSSAGATSTTQILAARPDAAWSDYQPPRRPLARRPRRARARGRTAAPATRSSTPAMRQLRQEGLRCTTGPA